MSAGTEKDAPAGEPFSEPGGGDDVTLVAAIAEGSESALARLYDRHAAMLFGLAWKILQQREEGEDVVQEVFLQVWRQARRYDPTRSAVSTWLVLLARSRAIDRLRTRQVRRRTVELAAAEPVQIDASPRGPAAVLERERSLRLQEELTRLPAEQRQVLELAFHGGLTQREIADRTGTPLGTVKTRTLLALRKLRSALGREREDWL